MKLDVLISDGENIVRDSKRSMDKDRIKARENRWIKNCNEFLRNTYPSSVLTSDFSSISDNKNPEVNHLVSILKGLRDVEDDLGMLH